MQLYNTLSRKIEEFHPLNPPNVTLYTCGPTVYDYTHIGHMRTYTNNDILKRTLTYFGYKVKHVMNVTDVGHLSGDDDTGEDKMEKGARKYGKTVWDLARFYTDFFFKTTDALNIILPDVVCKATDHIQAMIDLIKRLQQNGYVYETKEGLYFDTSKFDGYGKLSGQKKEDKIQKAREEVYVDPEKKHPADFALWLKRVARFSNHIMHWDSPWGDGFPGWHIECSAMSMEYLGDTIDIHAGGIDHIPVHHENEIAQSEGATAKQFVKYWFHNNFITVDNRKMSKSLNNFFTIDDLQEHRIEPLSLRLLFLQSHYRQTLNFTWVSVRGAQEAYKKLKKYAELLRKQRDRTILSEEKLRQLDQYRNRFSEAIANDLQTPQAMAVVWEMLKSTIPSPDKLDLLFQFDQVLGLKLSETTEERIPDQIIELEEERLKARKTGDFNKADAIRVQIESKGFGTVDTKDGYLVKKIK